MSETRPLVAADADRLLRLIEACDIADLGHPDYTREDVEDDFARPTWAGWTVAAADGTLAAFCTVERRGGASFVDVEVRVHPGAATELGPELLAFARARAAELAPDLDVHAFTSATAVRDRAWLEAAGGTVARHFWRMVIELPEEPPPPVVPSPPVTVEQPRDDLADLRTIHRVIDTAFLDHFGSTATEFDEWVVRQRSGSGADIGLWWLARVDGQPAAVLIGRAWPDMGWVQGLGTLQEFRGRGLGRLLLETAFGEFHARGYRTVSLGVDATNPTGAVALYESAGMKQGHEHVLYELPSIGPSPAGSIRSDSKNV